ncbi:MAG: DNA recombination protein RmuC [Pseudomonadota bacterium]
MTLTQEQLFLIGAGIAAGFVLGVLVAALVAMRRLGHARLESAVLESELKSEQALSDEREAAFLASTEQLKATFDQLANRSLKDNSESFLRLAQENLGKFQTKAESELGARQKAVENLIAPVAKALSDTREQIAKVEHERARAFGGINQQLELMNNEQRTLRSETANLVNALKRPEVRGRWGEITLKRLVELAGMVEHCDFTEQAHTTTPDGAVRPDMLVRLPENRLLVVDVKTPLDAYLAAVEATDDETKQQSLTRHARQVKERIRELSSKAYWKQFSTSPDFIILFLPGDQFLSAALNVDNAILDDALAQKVILATPSNLMALLKTVSYGWRQVQLAKNAETISQLAETLHQRVGVFTDHMNKMGKTLGQSVEAYNKAVGSLEKNVLPGARKFTELGIRHARPIAELDPIEKTTRALSLTQKDIEQIDARRDLATRDDTVDQADEAGSAPSTRRAARTLTPPHQSSDTTRRSDR